MSKVIMDKGGCLREPQGVSARWKETAQTRAFKDLYLRLSRKVVTLPPWLTMSSLPVTTSYGTILIFSLPESQTYSAKLKKLF